MVSLKTKQKGMTTASMLMVGSLVAFVAFSAFKLYTPYYNDFAVKTALENMAEEGATIAAMSPSEIRQTLGKRIYTSGVTLGKDDVEITKDKGAITISINYEVRTHMYANIDAVTVFNHSLTVSK
ncbi:MAG: DUF4845 domain-containing protein [Pseudomonadales bacterium]|nr:DUF4845 domain-containing protein [Pseudomonadales bacterium]